jgi:hypothetical protein
MDSFWRGNMSQEADIWKSSKFNKEISILIPLSECVIEKNVTLREKLFYILDQYNMNIISNLETFDEVDMV